MAQVDWTVLTNSLAPSIVDRGVTDGFTPPTGGGSWVYGFHSLLPDQGAAGLYYNHVNFGPMAKGGSIRMAMRRLAGQDSAPFLFCSLQSNAVSALGYLLGLAHSESPARIVLMKGTPTSGLNHVSAVAYSSAAYQVDSWLHLRLDVIRQPSDDVWLRVYRNTASVASPSWVLEPGLELLIDDALGITTGSQPYLGGYAGFGYFSKAVGRYAFVDYAEIFRQL